MTRRVIQGCFIGAANASAATAQPKSAPQRAASVPRPGFVPPVLQRHGTGRSVPVDGARLGLTTGGGKPLPDPLRRHMEAALGADFSGVRVHIGPQAERIGAVALTQGGDIYFAPGRYRPDTASGRQLLGRELAHVVQQRQGRVPAPVGTGMAVVRDQALDAEADRLGRRAASFPASQSARRPPMAMIAAQPSSPMPISAVARNRLGEHRAPAPSNSGASYKPAKSALQLASATADTKAPKKKQKEAVVILMINGVPYGGKSSGQYGHAEMAALHTFIGTHASIPAAATAITAAHQKTVECHNQPVCGSCKIVLQALGFVKADDETVLSDEPSGGVAWLGNDWVQRVMEALGKKKEYENALAKGKK